MDSHADSHDLDKLARWRRDLTANMPDKFPVYAVFLVSANDRAAHDIFRKFRTSFEARRAGFERLVIFGQHGVSSTVRHLLEEFGLPQEAIPALALFSSAETDTVYTIPLPAGDAADTPQDQAAGPWQGVLAEVERAAEKGEESMETRLFSGITQRRLEGGTLDKLVGKLLSYSRS